MNLIEKASRIKNGIKILHEWIGSGGVPAHQEVAQARTNTCLACPLNQPGAFLTEAIAESVREEVELKNEIGLKTEGIEKLHSCAACSCFLPLKIFIPIENLAAYENPESLAKYDSLCWVLSESKLLSVGN